MIFTTEVYDKIKICFLSPIALVYHILNIIPSKNKNSNGVHNIRKLFNTT